MQEHKKNRELLFMRRFWTTYNYKQESPRQNRERLFLSCVVFLEIVQISAYKEKQKRFYNYIIICLLILFSSIYYLSIFKLLNQNLLL